MCVYSTIFGAFKCMGIAAIVLAVTGAFVVGVSLAAHHFEEKKKKSEANDEE